jgi:pyridoxine/pyridoxamine 5'-phosphate oxidase
MADLAADARRIVDANLYMTVATADGDGRPWASPVWFAHDGYARFLWVSKPESRHSQNLAGRADVGIVIFDSTAGPGAAEAVFLEGHAERAAKEDEARYIEIFNDRSQALGWPSWNVDDVRAPALLRLYVATASAHYLLAEGDRRIELELA